MLELRGVSKRAAGQTIAQDIDLTLREGVTNILLGATLSGKTSLMRMMAGLDRPDSGDILFDGQSVIGVPVQKRAVAMVYQQFINYPSMTVFDNIASPLRVEKRQHKEIEKRVHQAAEMLQISDYLQRLPAELSGGQQQRVALARALVKEARLVLLDEPLANLDYKLREELRIQLPQFFLSQGSVLVYATTEPVEALVLGGHVAVMHEGRVVQSGSTHRVFRSPENLIAATAFSDPPMNTAQIRVVAGRFTLDDQNEVALAAAGELDDGRYTIGLRPHHLRLARRSASDIELSAEVVVNEITGSESYIHFNIAQRRWVALAPGVLDAIPGTALSCFVDPADFYYFHDASGKTLVSRQAAVG